jgi:hypothetical protein
MRPIPPVNPLPRKHWMGINESSPNPRHRNGEPSCQAVVKVLEDEHDFIYVLNGEGLWVISAPDRRPTQDNSSAYGG